MKSFIFFILNFVVGYKIKYERKKNGDGIETNLVRKVQLFQFAGHMSCNSLSHLSHHSEIYIDIDVPHKYTNHFQFEII